MTRPHFSAFKINNEEKDMAEHQNDPYEFIYRGESVYVKKDFMVQEYYDISHHFILVCPTSPSVVIYYPADSMLFKYIERPKTIHILPSIYTNGSTYYQMKEPFQGGERTAFYRYNSESGSTRYISTEVSKRGVIRHYIPYILENFEETGIIYFKHTDRSLPQWDFEEVSPHCYYDKLTNKKIDDFIGCTFYAGSIRGKIKRIFKRLSATEVLQCDSVLKYTETERLESEVDLVLDIEDPRNWDLEIRVISDVLAVPQFGKEY